MIAPVRLAKRLAELVSCSRREAELYIEGGWVMVDGRVVEEPQFKVSQQKIELHPDATLAPATPMTILFYQLSGNAAAVGTRSASPIINGDNRAADDPSGIPALKRHFSRLTPTLPLEANASGLLVLTQDWRVVRKLVDDATTVEQEYIVEVAGDLAPSGLKQFNHRVSIDGRELPPVKVSWQSESRLRFAIKGAQPGQIAQACQNAGLQVVSMRRIRIGRVAMAKLLPGQWRFLPLHERF